MRANMYERVAMGRTTKHECKRTRRDETIWQLGTIYEGTVYGTEEVRIE